MKNAYALAVTSAVGALEAQEGVGCHEAYNRAGGRLRPVCARDEPHAGAAGRQAGKHHACRSRDLYVTVYGGRTRMLGKLLGRGMTIEEALKELSGVTLESVSIATRARCGRSVSAPSRGEIDPAKISRF